MVDPFDKILSDFKSSKFDYFTQQSIKWWRSTIRELYGSEASPSIGSSRTPDGPATWVRAFKQRYGRTLDRTPMGGKMYLFRYEPTTKKSLEYWDNLPLIIALEKKRDGFMGLNLHFLSKRGRGMLLNLLAGSLKNATEDDVEQDFKGEDNLRNIRSAYKNYGALTSNSRIFKAAYPCIRRYKFTGLRSQLVEVPVTDWELASYLPSDYFFDGASLEYIHRDSINKRSKKFG